MTNSLTLPTPTGRVRSQRCEHHSRRIAASFRLALTGPLSISRLATLDAKAPGNSQIWRELAN
jgi:hypothetical protein